MVMEMGCRWMPRAEMKLPFSVAWPPEWEPGRGRAESHLLLLYHLGVDLTAPLSQLCNLQTMGSEICRS